MLGRSEILPLLKNGTVENGDESRVGQVSYDLATRQFYHSSSGPSSSCSLMPGESVFVDSEEVIDLPADLACRVCLRNSRIREGLSLDAPVYFPTHKTRVFFRVTNLSDKRLDLNAQQGIAAIIFEQVEGSIGPAYAGAFQDELDFTKLASYEDIYREQIHEVENKVEEARDLERRMYGNVLTLMAIFVSIFTLVNVNLATGLTGTAPKTMIVLNLATVGSLLALLAVLCAMLVKFSPAKRSNTLTGVLAVFSVLAFVGAILCAALVP